MQLSQLPARILQAFANAGLKNTIPQTSAVPGAASFNQGFPPLTMTALNAGGIPPAGQDFNGIFNALSLIQQWQSAGGSFSYDATWSTANNGYPVGAVLMRADGQGFWFNTVDNNTANPDGATPTGWVPEWQYGITAVTGLTNANVTLTSLQYGRPVITLAGTLTGNVQINFPAIQGEQWLVQNNTTGAFSVALKTAAGTGIIVAQGASASIWSDGTNILAASPGGGRLLRKLVYTRVAGVQNVSLNGAANTTTGASAYVPGSTSSYCIAKVQAGGGAGGGPTLPTAGNVTLGSPGGSGAYGESYIPVATIGASQVVTVGLGGAKVVGGTGSTGGTSSLGSLLTCAGGIGGGLLASAAPPTVAGNSSNVVATGANLFQVKGTGSTATFSVTAAASGGLGGCGGSSIFGGGGAGAAGNNGGIDAVNFGSGGSGAVINNGYGGSTAGGSGFDGIVIIEEYA